VQQINNTAKAVQKTAQRSLLACVLHDDEGEDADDDGDDGAWPCGRL
jgi:hypothetical protein